jgi:hypothetical protein
VFTPVKPSVEQVCRSLGSISRRTGPDNEKRSNTATISHEPRLGDAANGELASHNHRARASVGELDDGPGTRNRRNAGAGRRAADTEHVPTQSAASSVAATPPPAFLRCRLSGTLDDGAPLGIIQQRDFGGFRGFHRRPVTDAGDRFRFPTAAQATIALRSRASWPGASGLPRAQQSRRARRDDWIARTMHKRDRAKLPAVAALLLFWGVRLLVCHAGRGPRRLLLPRRATV